MTRHRGTTPTPEILAIPRHVQAHGCTAAIAPHHWRITDPATTHRALRRAGVPPMSATRHKAKPHREQVVSS